jgi:hypothetical protein
MTVDTQFTGTNGAPWPSPWTTSLLTGTTGGAIDIQSNRGRLRAHDGAYRRARCVASGSAFSDGRVEFRVRFTGVTEQYAYLWFRVQTWGDEAFNLPGYSLHFGVHNPWGSKVSLVRGGGVSEVALVETTVTWESGVDYNVVVEASGSALRAKVWKASEAEPGVWTLEASDSAFASGEWGCSLLSGATSADRQADFDYITFVPAYDPENPPSAWTDWVETETDFDPSVEVTPSPWTNWVETTTDTGTVITEWWLVRDGALRPAVLRTPGEL